MKYCESCRSAYPFEYGVCPKSGAIAAFEDVLREDPENPAAQLGLTRVKLLKAERAEAGPH